MMSFEARISWKHALVPALAVALLAIYPQLSLWISKGASWRGSYVVSNYDEAAYSAYANALLNGKPRTNDPFVGADDTGHESLYSIQFIPAYVVTIPAKLLGLSTSTAFIVLSVVSAILSSLALFWLLFSVIRQPLIAAAGTLVVLCLATAASIQGELSRLLGGVVLIDFLPFLRRYQPGLAFPLFFIFCGLVWRSHTLPEFKRSLLYASVAGICFAVLVFSYFYLWTTAAAWLGCFSILGLMGRKDSRKRILTVGGIIAVLAIAALIPYRFMLSNRSPNLDEVQLLTATHSPELLSPSLIIGLLLLLAISVLAYSGKLRFTDESVLLAASFAITPLILFNQQIVTGRSLQPVHYEIFISNYLVLTAAILLASTMIPEEKYDSWKKPLVYIAAAAVLWGAIEAASSTKYNAVAAEIRDESVPAIRLIEKKEAERASVSRPVVLATNFITSDIIPTFSTFRPLWNAHTSSAGGVNQAENERLFFLYLYYSGYTEKDLTEELASNSFEVTAAVFGSERALPALGRGNAIGASDIQKAARKYSEFVRSFGSTEAGNPTLNYLIVPGKAEPTYSNLDRWYQRDAGEESGLFKVYRLTPRFTVTSMN